MVENKRTWKEKVHVETQVEERLRKNLTLKSREATKLQKKALKTTKKEFKLSKKNYKQSLKKHKLTLKTGKEPLSINHLLDKKKFVEQKKRKKAQKIAYKRTKKVDQTRVVNQVKRETKEGLKREATQKVRTTLTKEDTLNEAMTLYEKTQQAKFNMRTALKTGKTVKNLSVKTAKDTYGLGNRLFNFSRGRGFQRTPKDFT
ncbi:CHAP domain-containing protein, partial [Enterococcus faecalis]|nr:CHAP domain-containing protein [Enterococcus faecalis]EHZ5644858.1 CHAP domain-containing protein [Enterococcus faecalis]EKB7626320.1 CHAP domain-containing protein [Enterococcus faecalis]